MLNAIEFYKVLIMWARRLDAEKDRLEGHIDGQDIVADNFATEIDRLRKQYVGQNQLLKGTFENSKQSRDQLLEANQQRRT